MECGSSQAELARDERFGRGEGPEMRTMLSLLAVRSITFGASPLRFWSQSLTLSEASLLHGSCVHYLLLMQNLVKLGCAWVDTR